MQQIIVVFDNLKDWISELFSMIPKFMYFLCATLMSLVDSIQYVLRKLAGLDVYYIDGNQQSGDITFNFLKSIFDTETKYPAIKNTFWALVIFGLILLIIATIVAVIRQEYMPSSEDMKQSPGNNKLAILKRMVKSMFLFLIVPVSCIFGLALSDGLLYGLDTITTSSSAGMLEVSSNALALETASNGHQTYTHFDFFGSHMATTSATFSGSMFKAAAYDANRIRINESYEYNDDVKTFYQYLIQGDITNFGVFNSGMTQEECAQLLDDAFAHCVKLKNEQSISTDGPLSGLFGGNFSFTLVNGQKIEYFSKFNVGLVYYYYDLWYFNFLIGFAFLIVCLKLYYNIIMGLMKRIVELVGLFMISPPIIAIMPLDGGKTFSNWRTNFISKALSAYGAIIGMNILFLLLPYLNEIELFSSNLSLLNTIFQCLFLIVGLTMVEGFISLLSGFIGAGDAGKSGKEVAGSVGDILAKSAKMTGAAAGAGVKVATLPYKATKQLGHGIDVVTRRKALANKYMANGMTRSDARARARQEETMLKSKQRLNRIAKSALDNVTTKPSTRLDLKKSFESQWNNGGAEQAYEKYLMDDKVFRENLNSSYAGRSEKFADLSLDDWLKTAQGIKAKQNLVQSAGTGAMSHLETLNQFKTNAGSLDEKGNIVGALQNSAGASAFADALQKSYEECLKQHRQTRFRSFENAVGNVSNVAGIKNFESLGSFFMDETKSALVQGGKGGFGSMIKAFKGLSAKQIEQDELIKKLQKEEKAKVKIQEDLRKKK